MLAGEAIRYIKRAEIASIVGEKRRIEARGAKDRGGVNRGAALTIGSKYRAFKASIAK